MPQIYHTALHGAEGGRPLVLQLLVADEGRAFLSVFLEYEWQGEQRRLRLLPIDGYRGEESYSLYECTVCAAHLSGESFSYRFFVEGEYTRSYTLILQSACYGDSEKERRYPCVLPLLEGERPALSADRPCMRFLTFSEQITRLMVYAQIDGVWQGCVAQKNELDIWECHLPLVSIAKTGKRLLYYVEVSEGGLTALLGDRETPLSVRLVDEIGPEILRVTPVNGETAQENPPALCVEYVDASGVDLSASKIFLDGKSVSENANWTENGASFRPSEPLCDGEHVWEISLRDARGNHTYQRVSFFVKGEAPARKKSLSAVRAAGLLINAFATLKNLFSDTD